MGQMFSVQMKLIQMEIPGKQNGLCGKVTGKGCRWVISSIPHITFNPTLPTRRKDEKLHLAKLKRTEIYFSVTSSILHKNVVTTEKRLKFWLMQRNSSIWLGFRVTGSHDMKAIKEGGQHFLIKDHRKLEFAHFSGIPVMWPNDWFYVW